jgi:hypothetical protein
VQRNNAMMSTELPNESVMCRIVSYVAGREDEPGARRQILLRHTAAAVEAASRKTNQANWRPPRLHCLSWVKATRGVMHSVPTVSPL